MTHAFCVLKKSAFQAVIVGDLLKALERSIVIFCLLFHLRRFGQRLAVWADFVYI